MLFLSNGNSEGEDYDGADDVDPDSEQLNVGIVIKNEKHYL